MVRTEHAALGVDVFQEEPRLAHQIGRPHHLNLARLDPIVQGSAGVDAQRQESDKFRLHHAHGLRRVDGVGLPVAVEPSHAVDGGDGDGDASRLAAQRVFHGLRRGDALVELQEQLLIAAFQTDVDERQPVLAQLAQLLVRFAFDGLGGGIGGNACTLGEVFADEVQHLQQYFPAGGVGKNRKYVQAVDDVSFAIRKGETLGLVGESGCGKTTTGRTLLRLYEPTGGKIYYDGNLLFDKEKNIAVDMLPYRRRMQIVFQDPYASLDGRKNVYESIAEPIKNLKKCSRDEERKTVEKFIEQMELPKSILSQRSGELSGGQQKRVCIARALAADPDYIIFDEAVSGLDAVVRKNVLDLLIKIQKNSGKGCLLITHDIDAALYISQRIAVMKSGRILESVNYSGNIQVFKSEYAKTLISSSSSGIKKYDISVKNG